MLQFSQVGEQLAWDRIIGLQREKKILQRAFLENRYAGAYCFWGMEGLGKDGLAIEFARLANCKKPLISETTADSCGECSSCLQFNKLSSSNLTVIFSLPTGKGSDSKDSSTLAKMTDEQMEEIREQLAMKAENYYHRISLPGANQIKINSIRDIKKNLSLSSSDGRRFVLITRAEEMTFEAANAFLKTLEEPNENITIILTTSKQNVLLQTILSRCQQIHCQQASDEDIASALHTRHNIKTEDAKIIAAFSQGSYQKAMEFSNEEIRQKRNDVIDLLRTSLKKRNFRAELLGKIEIIVKEKDKKKSETMLEFMLTWLRDAYIISNLETMERLINIDQEEVLNKFAKNFQNSDYIGAIGEVEKAATMLRRNVNLQLVMLALFLNIRRIFLGQAV
ncbi:MAG: hypothetical protein HW421_2816 [Ignavibacteria bacterium]|nr:hypothetical protein [Ignavibacteria bacterium]